MIGMPKNSGNRAIAAVALTIAAGAVVVGCASGAPASAAQDPAATVQHETGLVEPGRVELGAASVEDATPIVHTAQKLYTFWNTGEKSWLDQAVSASFVDNTLPEGRPQGPSGPLAASQQFRAAVPDLRCELAELYITGDTFTAHLVFSGRFTGVSGRTQGTGQSIRFDAIDIQHVGGDGLIDQDWHIEDNLTFQRQAGLLP